MGFSPVQLVLMPRNDQPFVTYLYNTDQFTDPVFGFTVHDDGLPTYTSARTGITYTKQRTYNGQAGGYISFNITLVGGPVPPAGPFLTDEFGNILTDAFGNPLTPG